MPSKQTVYGKEIPRAVLRMLKKMKSCGGPIPITKFKRPVVDQALARGFVYKPTEDQLAMTQTGKVALRAC